MKIKFNLWAADELIKKYIEFIKKRNSKEIFVNYLSEKYGLKETMEGRIEANDPRLKELANKIQYLETTHYLELFQKDWKIKFKLSLFKDFELEDQDNARLEFDDSLKKEVWVYFNEFEPEEMK